MKTTIIPAVLDDLLDVASVQVRSWQAGYADYLPKAFLEGLDAGAKWEEWKTIFLSRTSGENGLYLARQADKTVGFIAFGESRDPDKKGWGEIYALYLIPEAWGQGVGEALFKVARQCFHKQGLKKAHVWLLDANSRALRAYKKWGGHSDDRAPRPHCIGGKSVKSISLAFDVKDN